MRLNRPLLYLVLICLFVISFPPLTGGVQLSLQPTQLRVMLESGTLSATIGVYSGSYELVDYFTNRVLATLEKGVNRQVAVAGPNLQIVEEGQIQPSFSGRVVYLKQTGNEGGIFTYNGKKYRGELYLEIVNDSLLAVNSIDVEQYLYGVVGLEIGSSADDEALKAQAVVSRTYALYHKEHPNLNYDIGTTTRWQVYGGYDGEVTSGKRVVAAVDSTAGQVIFYDNKLIQAFFHANAGGYTENCENIWPSTLPYIKAVPSPFDSYAETYPHQANGWPANTYKWSKTVTREELSGLIDKWNTTYTNDQIDVGEIIGITVSKLQVDPHDTTKFLNQETKSGRVTKLELLGTKGSKVLYKDSIRSFLGLRSTLFDISFQPEISLIQRNGSITGVSGLHGLAVQGSGKITTVNGDVFVISGDNQAVLPETFTSITFTGKGHGHGLGMSQWGARGMAASGYNYRQIIEHYYNKDKLAIKEYASRK